MEGSKIPNSAQSTTVLDKANIVGFQLTSMANLRCLSALLSLTIRFNFKHISKDLNCLDFSYLIFFLKFELDWGVIFHKFWEQKTAEIVTL